MEDIKRFVFAQLQLSNYIDYVQYCDVFFTIMMLSLVCHNCVSILVSKIHKRLHKLLMFYQLAMFPKGMG